LIFENADALSRQKRTRFSHGLDKRPTQLDERSADPASLPASWATNSI